MNQTWNHKINSAGYDKSLPCCRGSKIFWILTFVALQWKLTQIEPSSINVNSLGAFTYWTKKKLKYSITAYKLSVQDHIYFKNS